MAKNSISVLIATYNPHINDVLRTIRSVIYQKGIDVQVVVTDDGSKEFPKEEIEGLFKAECLENYKLVVNKENQGTIKNFLQGASYCTGTYIKVLGQGDLLLDEYTLKDLVDFAESNELDLVASKAVYFQKVIDTYRIVKADDMPQFPNLYSSPFWQKRLSVLFEDDAQGATLLYKKEKFIKYLMEVADKVVFIEDKIQKLMILDGCKVRFYNRVCIFYESTCGISNNTSREMILHKDKMALNEIILSHIASNGFKKEFRNHQMYKERLRVRYSRIDSFKWSFCARGYFVYRIKKRLFPKKTDTAINCNFIDRCWN